MAIPWCDNMVISFTGTVAEQSNALFCAQWSYNDRLLIDYLQCKCQWIHQFGKPCCDNKVCMVTLYTMHYTAHCRTSHRHVRVLQPLFGHKSVSIDQQLCLLLISTSFLIMLCWNMTLQFYFKQGVHFTVHSLGSILGNMPIELCPQELLQAKGYIWQYIPCLVLMRIKYNIFLK